MVGLWGAPGSRRSGQDFSWEWARELGCPWAAIAGVGVSGRAAPSWVFQTHMSLVRRMRTSVPPAGTAGSCSAVMAAPVPSTWPA